MKKIIAENVPVVIYGLGKAGMAAFEKYSRTENIIAFCTSFEREREREKLPVVAPDQIPHNAKVLIASMYARDIALTLREHGISNYVDVTCSLQSIFALGTADDYFSNTFLAKNVKNILHARDLLADDSSRSVFDGIIDYRRTQDPVFLSPSAYAQYYHPKIPYTNCHSIVLCGAYDGDSIDALLQCCDSKLTIHAFEPAPNALTRLLGKYGRLSSVNIYAMALSDVAGIIPFNFASIETQCFCSDEKNTEDTFFVLGTRLDVAMANSPIDVVCIDIEGSERKALLGMREIIETQRPYIAVSVYHLPDDIWEIPLYLASICNEYEFYLGHHGLTAVDSVLYACPKWR